MSADFQSYELESVAELKGGFAFKSEDYTDTGRFILRTLNIDQNGRVTREGATFISEEKAKEYTRFELQPFDTLFVMVGATLGKTGLVKEEDLPALLNQNMWVIRADKNKINPLYLHYVFTQESKTMLGWASGAARDFARRDDYRKLKLSLPDRKYQDHVAAFLGAIDDKIALNRKINQTLEQMAQALFKSWFVDFDPVRAKMAGHQPEGMDAETAALFPAEFTATKLGLIPKGWEVRALDEIASYLNGLALQKFPPESHSDWLPVIKIAQLKKGDASGADKASSAIKPEYVVDNGNVLFSWSGSLEVDIWCGGKGALNQHLFKVTSDQFPKWFYYYWTKYYLQNFQAIASAKAVTMGHIQRKHLTEAKCVVPTADVLAKLDAHMAPLLDEQIALRLQAATLAQTRDQLLSKLLTGELVAAGEAES